MLTNKGDLTMANNIEERLARIEENFVSANGSTVANLNEKISELEARLGLLEKLLKFNDTGYFSPEPRVKSIDLGSVVRRVTSEVLETKVKKVHE